MVSYSKFDSGRGLMWASADMGRRTGGHDAEEGGARLPVSTACVSALRAFGDANNTDTVQSISVAMPRCSLSDCLEIMNYTVLLRCPATRYRIYTETCHDYKCGTVCYAIYVLDLVNHNSTINLSYKFQITLQISSCPHLKTPAPFSLGP